MKDLLVRPIHSIPFLVEHDLGVEAHIGRYEGMDTWSSYAPHVRAVHLPYRSCNLAALDDVLRERSLLMIKEAMDEALQYDVDRLVMHICGLESKDGSRVGSYDRLIGALQELAGHAARQRRTLCLENAMLQWGGAVKHWGDSRADWHRIYRDAGRENIRLTLDTSHAVTEVHVLLDPAERVAALWEFLADKEAIWRVHWSDSMVYTDAGKKDMHLVPGKGDLPREFHKAIKALPVPKLLEQKCTEAEVCEGLAFIAAL